MNALFQKLSPRTQCSGRECPRPWDGTLVLLAVALLGLAAAGCSAGAKPAATAARVNETAAGSDAAAPASGTNDLAIVPASVFHVQGPQSGRDPFFPGASRQKADATGRPAVAPRLALSSYLHLVGIRPAQTRPLALINRTSLAQGEEADVSVVITNHLNKIEVQKVAVRCLEIRRDSVLVRIAGEQGVQELRMAQEN